LITSRPGRPYSIRVALEPVNKGADADRDWGCDRPEPDRRPVRTVVAESDGLRPMLHPALSGE
jgi:hypothetical protein